MDARPVIRCSALMAACTGSLARFPVMRKGRVLLVAAQAGELAVYRFLNSLDLNGGRGGSILGRDPVRILCVTV